MEFSVLFREIFWKYMLYLDDGGIAPTFEQHRQHIDGLVHCSNLMDCPLKAAKEFSKATPVLPQLTKRNNPTLLQRMNQGNMCAQPFQEALLWAKDQNILKETQIEPFVKSEELKLQGQMDAFVTELDGTTHIIEMKHRLPQWKYPTAQPRMSDVFQQLGYNSIVKPTENHLVIINTPQYADFFDETKGFMVWTLYKDSEYSDGYILQDENMDAWNHQNNHGGYINDTTLLAEIEHQLEYINGKDTPPIDLADSDEAWQCRRITKYSKEGKVGIIHKMCSMWCHDENTQLDVPYILGDDGEFIILGS